MDQKPKKKSDPLKVKTRVTLECRDQHHTHFWHHSNHDTVADATKTRKRICSDLTEKKNRSLWRIVEWTGKVSSVLPAHEA